MFCESHTSHKNPLLRMTRMGHPEFFFWHPVVMMTIRAQHSMNGGVAGLGRRLGEVMWDQGGHLGCGHGV